MQPINELENYKITIENIAHGFSSPDRAVAIHCFSEARVVGGGGVTRNFPTKRTKKMGPNCRPKLVMGSVTPPHPINPAPVLNNI